jgi:type I restriction enzyme, S subunit
MMADQVPISDFCRTGSGTTPSRKKISRYYGGAIPWVKSGELREGEIVATQETVTDFALAETSLKLVPSGALLVAMYGATVGRVGLLGVSATTNQAICHIVPDQKRADTRYLFHALQQKAKELVRRGVGGAQPNISQGVIKDTRVYLPPLDEQKRIAAILDQADALRRLRQRALDKLNTLGQSIFYEMFGDGETDDKSVELSDLVEPGDKINYGVVQPGNESIDGVPLVRVGDLLEPDLNHKELKKISRDIEKKYKRSRLNGNEVLIACVGSIGAIALASFDLVGFNIARAVARVPLNSKITNRVFVAEQLKMPRIQRYFGVETRAVAQPTLNIKQIKETKIILPRIELQNEYAQRISELSAAIKITANHLGALNFLFASLQQRAFHGDL